MIESIIDRITSPIYLFLLAGWGITIFSVKGAIMEKIKAFKISDFNLYGIFRPKFKYTIPDLVIHDVFRILKERKDEQIHDFLTNGELDETKKKIFKDFRDLKMDSTIRNVKRIVTEYKKDFKKEHLKQHVYQCFLDCNECLAKDIERHLKLKGVPQDKVKKLSDDFFVIRRNAMKDYGELLERVFASDFYENNFQRINAIFDNLAFESSNMIRDIESAFNGVNGMFKDLEYGE